MPLRIVEVFIEDSRAVILSSRRLRCIRPPVKVCDWDPGFGGKVLKQWRVAGRSTYSDSWSEVSQ
jgi:hypothetical protein